MHRGAAFSILFCFCFLSLAGTLFAPPPKKVERKCSDGKDNDGDGDIDCADSDCASKDVCTGGGDPPIAFPSTLDVQWSISGAGDPRNEISESPARHCFLESLTSGNYASYHCHHNVVPISPVFYMLEDQTVQQTARKGDATFCSAFVGELDFHTNASYQVSWDCRSIPCTVQIANWAEGVEVQTKIPGLTPCGSRPILMQTLSGLLLFHPTPSRSLSRKTAPTRQRQSVCGPWSSGPLRIWQTSRSRSRILLPDVAQSKMSP